VPTFPVLEHVAYLNAGTFGPLARETIDAVNAQTAIELERGRSGKPYFDAMIELRTRLRGQFADLLGTTPEHIALTASTTTGCHVVLSGLRLEPGDEIVTTDEEHFGLLGPLHVSGARVRVAATRGRPEEEALEAVLAEVGPRTRLVAVSHVSWMTGHILPVAAIKEQTHVPLLVDGAQSVGAIPVELGDVDFYTVSGQKWLCGPDATGALYVRDPDAVSVALPTYWSREAHELDGTFAPVEGARRFDTGPLPVPSLVGLEIALQIARPSPFDDARAIAGRCRELLSERFEVVTEPDHATLVTFAPDGDAANVVAGLHEAEVVVREVPETGWVRVSCGYWNTEEHLERLMAALT
jgi:L-cysteine/cystine lyase